VSPKVIHLDARNGLACATATVRVSTPAAEDVAACATPDVTVVLSEYSTGPPGVRVRIRPSAAEKVLAGARGEFAFELCAVGG
jgi:hypothetical protein